MDKKICLYCNKKLKPTKRFDFVNRQYHFKCIDRMNQERYDEELEDFIKFLSSQINKLDIV